MRCHARTEWGRCCQRALEGDSQCGLHVRVRDQRFTPNRYYHEKVATGKITPGELVFTEHEIHAMLNGRYRGDGRRIDQYVLPEPLLIDIDGL